MFVNNCQEYLKPLSPYFIKYFKSCHKIPLVLHPGMRFCFTRPALVNQNGSYLALETSFVDCFFFFRIKIMNQACIAFPA